MEFDTVEDLIHISGPLTEDAIIKVLQARFYKGLYYVSDKLLFSETNTQIY